MMTTEQPTPDPIREAATEAVARILYQRHAGGMAYPVVNWAGETGEYRAAWMGDAGPIVDAVLAVSGPLLRAQIADELREVRPGLGWHPSREQESFQRGYDTAVYQLDRAVARGAGRG